MNGVKTKKNPLITEWAICFVVLITCSLRTLLLQSQNAFL